MSLAPCVAAVLVACSAAGVFDSAERNKALANRALEAEAERKLSLVSTWQRNIQDPAAEPTTAIDIARVVDEPGTATVYSATGTPPRRTVHVVVRLESTYQDSDGQQRAAHGCFELLVKALAYLNQINPVDCPAKAPMTIPPAAPPPADLSGLRPLVEQAVAMIAEPSLDAVRAAITPIVAPVGAQVDAKVQDGVIGASALLRNFDCIAVRIEGSNVEVWRPSEVSPVYGVPGELACSPGASIVRAQQRAPH